MAARETDPARNTASANANTNGSGQRQQNREQSGGDPAGSQTSNSSRRLPPQPTPSTGNGQAGRSRRRDENANVEPGVFVDLSSSERATDAPSTSRGRRNDGTDDRSAAGRGGEGGGSSGRSNGVDGSRRNRQAVVGSGVFNPYSGVTQQPGPSPGAPAAGTPAGAAAGEGGRRGRATNPYTATTQSTASSRVETVGSPRTKSRQNSGGAARSSASTEPRERARGGEVSVSRRVTMMSALRLCRCSRNSKQSTSK